MHRVDVPCGSFEDDSIHAGAQSSGNLRDLVNKEMDFEAP